MSSLWVLWVIAAFLFGLIIGGETRWWIVWRQSDRQTWLDWQDISNKWKKLYFDEKAKNRE